MENVIAVVVNQAFVHYARPLVTSIQKNWPAYPKILLFLSPDVTTESESWFKNIPNLVINRYNPHDFEYRKYLSDGSGKFDSQEYNDAGFFFLNFWSEMFKEYNNVLILDADMLVLKDLTPLMEMEGFVGISAANNRMLPAFSISDKSPITKLIKLTKSYVKALSKGMFIRPYVSVNGGVIKIGREDRTESKFNALIDILKNFRDVCPTDQELILLWMNKFKKPISHDFRMNFHSRFYNALEDGSLPQRYREQVIEAAKDIHIMHYNGPKPDTKEFLYHPWSKGRPDLIELYESYLT